MWTASRPSRPRTHSWSRLLRVRMRVLRRVVISVRRGLWRGVESDLSWILGIIRFTHEHDIV